MNDADPRAGLPWYRYFWPWFIVVLLSASVVAGIATVVIAFANQDSLVTESWYENGTQINRRLESEANAVRRSIRAELRIDDVTGEVRVELAGQGVAEVRELELDLSHPTQASSDRSITLVRLDSSSFRGQLSSKLSGRWYATLIPLKAVAADDSSTPRDMRAESDSWRLATTLHLPSAEPIVIGGSG
jgi:hypothetical protein